MKKPLYINQLYYEMLIDTANKKKPKKKPEQYVEDFK